MSATITTVAPTIDRDRFGRPLIVPPDGGKPTAYTRATTLAGTLDDLYGLMGWKQRQTALGLADRPDLQLAVTTHRDDKRRLDGICKDALEAAASSASATVGTAIHELSEKIDRGEELPTIPDDVAADLEAYRQATAPLTVRAIELFTVLDDIQVAGTADRIVEWGGQHFIADLKTGKSIDLAAQKIAIQLALYSHGQIYDPTTGARENLPDVHQGAGLVIHLPAGTGRCELHWINIRRGWEMVQTAIEVRAWRKEKGLLAPFTP